MGEKTMSTFLKLFITSALLSIVLTIRAQTNESIQDWAVSCSKDCSATQTLATTDMRLKFAVTLSKIEQSNKLVMRFDLPLGMYLPSGLGISVGDMILNVPYTTCIPNGCKALLVVDEQLEKALSAQNTLKMRYFSSEASESEVVFSLAGSSLVIKKVKS